MHKVTNCSVIIIGYVNIVKAKDIVSKTIPIALYLLNFYTTLDTIPADINPPIINIEEAIE